MARIAIAGLQHETNTFAPSKANYQAFEAGGGWPALAFGAPILAAVAGANIPIAGAIEALLSDGHELVPLVWGAASPSAQVTTDAFERIVGEMIARLKQAGKIDGVYLDLHGAMVTEQHDDGEGEILRRIRAVVGDRVPIVASLDLHANVTRAMMQFADALTIYRTYPHVDMAATGLRAALMLLDLLNTGQNYAKAFVQFDFLTGIPSQCSFIEPCKSLFDLLASIERQSGAKLSFAPGFPMADFPECGMSAMAYHTDAARAQAALAQFAQAVRDAEPQFVMNLLSPEDAVRRAIDRGVVGAPVVLADTQDNPGAGGNGDTVGLLDALLRARAPNAVLGLLIDPANATRAAEVGVGNSADFALGATSGVAGHEPLRARLKVLRLGDGQFTCTGPMFKGFRMNLGPMALLEHDGVKVVLASRKCQAADQQMFRHVGIEPIQQRLIALKSSVHFRADFEPIAKEVLVVRAPGPALADPVDFAWTRLRPGIRMRPLGPIFEARS
jgi:microcystin degradation protein MlrC